MGGGVVRGRGGGSLVGKASFWIGTDWIVTFGCAVWYAAAACVQTVLRYPVVALFHQVRVTCLFPVELEVALLPLLLHAARVSAAVAARVMAARFRMLRMVVS